SNDCFRRVAEDVRSPRANVVNEFAALNVGDLAALTGCEEQRRVVNGFERAHRAVYAAGDVAACFVEGFTISRHSFPAMVLWQVGIRFKRDGVIGILLSLRPGKKIKRYALT